MKIHHLPVTIERMTPEEYKHEGAYLIIQYNYFETIFGMVVIANTSKGICHVAFFKIKKDAFDTLLKRFPKAQFINESNNIQQNVVNAFTKDSSTVKQITLHIKGTDFQHDVWEALLTIPAGDLSTYGSIAKQIKKPLASRAVGTAIGRNPIAFIIPCHRVVQTNGMLGGYMWGVARKRLIIDWEANLY